MTLLAETWPFFAAIGLVALITYGALRPYLSKGKNRAEPRKGDTE